MEQLSVENLRQRLKGLRDLVDQGLFTEARPRDSHPPHPTWPPSVRTLVYHPHCTPPYVQDDFARMRAAYVAAEMVHVGRLTGMVVGEADEQEARRIFWSSLGPSYQSPTPQPKTDAQVCVFDKKSLSPGWRRTHWTVAVPRARTHGSCLAGTAAGAAARCPADPRHGQRGRREPPRAPPQGCRPPPSDRQCECERR